VGGKKIHLTTREGESERFMLIVRERETKRAGGTVV
jgi:hypothetical protein